MRIRFLKNLSFSIFVMGTCLTPVEGYSMDTTIYREAYEYVLNSEEIQKFYKRDYGMDSLQIKVSNEIIRSQVIFFQDEISGYELKDYTELEKDSILDILKERHYASDPVRSNNNYLSSFNLNKEFKIILFFSEIEENKLYAVLEIYDGFSEKYEEIIKVNQTSVVKMLFYLNPDKNIEKVFINYLAR